MGRRRKMVVLWRLCLVLTVIVTSADHNCIYNFTGNKNNPIGIEYKPSPSYLLFIANERETVTDIKVSYFNTWKFVGPKINNLPYKVPDNNILYTAKLTRSKLLLDGNRTKAELFIDDQFKLTLGEGDIDSISVYSNSTVLWAACDSPAIYSTGAGTGTGRGTVVSTTVFVVIIIGLAVYTCSLKTRLSAGYDLGLRDTHQEAAHDLHRWVSQASPHDNQGQTQEAAHDLHQWGPEGSTYSSDNSLYMAFTAGKDDD
ncbi:hypothetical protein Hamer_G024666 [Homarus americanus]|uniref:Uncharacterized protein n=1 Tax=Homarus americanus TaxID=6706 RepID=A0A8J5J9L5_HOMAM|nr:hypothetical protein Hamer_G024666 [Homarus americanus]